MSLLDRGDERAGFTNSLLSNTVFPISNRTQRQRNLSTEHPIL